jgi:hypothetical protein
MKDFIQNILRYPKFLLLISAGVLSIVIAPLIPLLKRPATAAALGVFLVSGFVGVTLVLRGMLGLDTL